MKKIKLILILSFIVVNYTLIIANSFAQWIAQNSGTNQNLYDVEFINENTGWAVGDAGVVIKTTDSGNNWLNIPNPSGNFGGLLWSIFPVDSEYVYVTAGYDFIMKSTNGGGDWNVLSARPGSTTAFKGVYFLNRDTGWFLGTNKVFRTYDGGATLDSFYAPWFTNWEIYFKDINTGIFTGDGRVFKSIDGGENWFNTNVPTGSASMFRKLAVVDDNAWISGDHVIFKSTDFCDTWERIEFSDMPGGYAINFVNKDTGFIGSGLNKVFKTTNGGYNWHQQITDPSTLAFIASMTFVNDTVGWYVGGIGKIYHTTTGGEVKTGITSTGHTIPADFVLYQNFPNPFNPVTNIGFDIAKKGNVKLSIFDVLGKEIKKLVSEDLYPGTYQVSFDGSSLNSGIYYYRLNAGNVSKTMKMVLIK